MHFSNILSLTLATSAFALPATNENNLVRKDGTCGACANSPPAYPNEAPAVAPPSPPSNAVTQACNLPAATVTVNGVATTVTVNAAAVTTTVTVTAARVADVAAATIAAPQNKQNLHGGHDNDNDNGNHSHDDDDNNDNNCGNGEYISCCPQADGNGSGNGLLGGGLLNGLLGNVLGGQCEQLNVQLLGGNVQNYCGDQRTTACCAGDDNGLHADGRCRAY